MTIHSPPVFFARFRRHRCTPLCQGRAGASLNCCAQRLLKHGPSRAGLGLDTWGRLAS
jgi:hypothetical protein